jgi:hypothetical protein
VLGEPAYRRSPHRAKLWQRAWSTACPIVAGVGSAHAGIGKHEGLAPVHDVSIRRRRERPVVAGMISMTTIVPTPQTGQRHSEHPVKRSNRSW